MNKLDLKEGQEIYVKGRVAHTGDHLDIVLDKGSFIENAIVLHHEKPVVPQFVADWIEYCKRHNFTLFGCLDPENGFESLVNESFEGDVRKCIRWCRRESNIFARAWLDGYEVEKEKRYLVKMKGVNEECEYLVFGELSNTWKLRSLGAFGELRKHHTRKELEEAGFGEVFNSPLFEVEEVD